MNIAYKFRIYPNEEQRSMIAKTIGCCRFVYNHMLADKIAYYEEQKAMLHNTPASYKGQFPFLKEVDALALANAQLHKACKGTEKTFPLPKREPELWETKTESWKSA